MTDDDDTFWKNFHATLLHELDFETGWLMDNLPLGIAVASIDGVVRYVNRVFAHWIGFEPAEVVDRSVFDPLFSEATTRETLEHHFSAVVNFGRYDWFNVTMKHKQGGYFDMRTRGSLERIRGVPVVIGICEPVDLEPTRCAQSTAGGTLTPRRRSQPGR